MNEYEYAWTNHKINGRVIRPKINSLEYHMKIQLAPGAQCLIWCTENCEHPWGWWTVGPLIYLGFSTIEEKIRFCLSNEY